MNYRILGEHLHYLYVMSSTLLLPSYFLYTKTVLENGGMKCEPTLFYTWNNNTFAVFTATEASRYSTSCRSGCAATAAE